MDNLYRPSKITYIGETEKRGQVVKFGIKGADRSRHVYVIGQTGTGKSTLLEIMALQDFENKEGVIFLDPHGQSVENILDRTDFTRPDDVVYIAPHLQDNPIGFNIMEDIGYENRHLVASSLIAAFHKIWGAGSWSDRMEHILNNTLLALLEYPNTTLLDVSRMYANKAFRDTVVDNIKDPQVKRYWIEEYARYTDSYLRDATPAIQNKLGQFTSNPLIRNIVGQKKSTVNFREIMDNGQVCLVNLSKGLIGDNNARLLGVLFTTKVFLSALSRADLTRNELFDAAPCNFYVDEFQSFANSSFSSILSEARKYKLNLVLAHQYVGQLDEGGDGNPIRDAVFGNVGTFISFRIGPIDAELVEKQFAPVFSQEDLVALPRRHMYLTLNVDGAGTPPFSAKTFDIGPTPETSAREYIIKNSAEKYGRSKVEIEKQIKEDLEIDTKNPNPKPAPKYKKTNKNNQPPAKPPEKKDNDLKDMLGSFVKAGYEKTPDGQDLPPIVPEEGWKTMKDLVDKDEVK